MVYFLGRDVSIYIGTEAVTADKNIGALYASGSGTASCTVNSSDTSNLTIFAQTLEVGTARGTNWTAQSDVTGIDISIGATDEDITYIGQKGTGKVEIKKEYTIALTRKKNNRLWDIIFNGPTLSASAESTSHLKQGARWGLDGSDKIANGMANPKDYNDGTNVEAGYRLYVVLKTGTDGEIMAFPNCLIQAHTVSVNADGTSEETMEFVTQQNMIEGKDGDYMDVSLIATGDY